MAHAVIDKLTDVTFVIPVRIDSPERSRNVDVLVDFIVRHFDSTVLIMEADSSQRYFIKHNNPRIRYFFTEDCRPVFQHTWCMNLLYPKVDTPLIAGWDTDAIVPPLQIVDTAERVRSGEAVMGLAYNGYMYKTTVELAAMYQETKDLDLLTGKAGELRPMYGDLSTGGAFIVDTDKYLQAGGENEYFLGWGPEDFERVKRVEILYLQPIYRAKGGLFHLWHPRYLNSWYADRQYEISGKKEFLKVCGMSRHELWDYVKSWPWLAGLQKGDCGSCPQ